MLTYDPNVGFLRNGQQANLHGSVGRNVLDASTAAPGALEQSAYDPRYYEAYTDYDGDAGAVTRYRLKSEYADRLGGRTQLKSHSVGGYGEAIDPSKVEWDDEFGLLTSRNNIKDPATPRDNMLGNIAMAAIALPAAYAVAVNSGLLGAAGSGLGGAGSGGLGALSGLEPITLPALEGAAPTLASIEGLGTAAGAASGFPAGAGLAGPALETAGMVSNVPWYTQALANAGVNMTNPLIAARGVMGAANLINTLSGGRGGSGGGSGGSMSYDLKLPDGVQPLNPLGLLSGYTPRQIPLVPFMSQSSLLGGK